MPGCGVLPEASKRVDPTGLIVVSPAQRIQSMCANCELAFGCLSEEVRGRPVDELLPELGLPPCRDLSGSGEAIVPLVEGRTVMAVRRDGGRFAVRAHAFCEHAGREPRAVVVLSELGVPSTHQADVRMLVQALEQTADSVIVTSIDGRITYVNPGFERHTGYAREEVLGRTPNVIKSGLHTREFYEHLWRTILSGQPFRGMLVNRRKSGELLHEEKTITPIRDADGRIVSFVSTAKDVTERMRSEERMRVLVNMDSVTGLANRSLLNDRLQQALARARRQGSCVALLSLDLDRFKAVNDSHGHEAGDRLIARLAQRLRAALTDELTLARVGGDEFLVLMDPVSGADEAMGQARALLEACRQPLDFEGRRRSTPCSIGVAVYPQHGGDASTLLRNADIAMYRAKASGRNCVQLFASPMAEAIDERNRMEALLREAVEHGELSLRYQPQVQIATGRLFGVEALLRWSSPVLGAVPPASFIPVLEESGMIVEVGAWALRRAIEGAAAAAAAAGTLPLRLTVNISPRQFRDEGFLDLAREACAMAQRSRLVLEFEITESLLMEDMDGVAEKIREITALGIRFAIDDFGTGYSSLAYVQRFPLHVLKIDRSFIAQCLESETSTAIIRTIVRLSHTLGLATVAEGVETAQQMSVLRELGCDAVQGWIIRGPVEAHEAMLPVSLP